MRVQEPNRASSPPPPRGPLGIRLPAPAGLVVIALLALVLTSACASGGALTQRADVVWRQQIQTLGLDPGRVPYPLRTTDEMRAKAHEVVNTGDPKEQLSQLQTYLFDDDRFPFVYDAGGTYTAQETFELREGNCVSFTSLFIALGRTLGVPLQPALIQRGDVEKQGDLVVINTHLVALYAHDDGITMYDFAEQRDEPVKGLSVLDDLWLTAIVLNNQGVDALRDGDFDTAIRRLEMATRLTPEFTAAYGNLGVAHRKAGDPEAALVVYQEALKLESRSPTILNNLASLYRSMGLEDEARAALQAADLSKATPYLLITRGDLEMARGNLGKAMKLYKRARRSNPDIPAPWLAIARVQMRRDNLPAARKALERAMELAPENAEVQRLGENVDRLQGQSR